MDTNVTVQEVDTPTPQTNSVPTEVIVEAPKIETTETVETPITEEPPKVSKSAAKLASIKAREAAIERQRLEIEAKSSQIAQKEQLLSKDKILTSPSEALKALGITFEDLTNAILSEGTVVPEDKAELALKEVKSLREEREQEEKAKQEKAQREKEELEQARIDKVINDFKGRIDNVVVSSPDKYELVIANEAQGLVYDVVRAYFDKHGQILDPEKAADLVEDHLWKKAQKLLTVNKIKAVVAPVAEKKTLARTLSNSMVSAPAAQASPKAISEQDRLKRAASLIRYN